MDNKKGIISNYFKPSLYVRSFNDVNINLLKRHGIRLFISDLDNTLIPHYARLPNKKVVQFLKKLNEAGIEVAILSNNVKSRVKMFAERAGVKRWYANGRKPFKKVTKKIMSDFDVNPSEVVIMGDQVLMDILVANRLKCESILVQPIVSTDYKMNKFNMFIEKWIYQKLEKKNILRQGDFMRTSFWNKNNLL